MDDVIATISTFTATNWFQIIAILVAMGVPTGLWLATQRRERLKSFEPTPVIRATINRQSYQDGWRSVQLHIFSAAEEQQFKYENWRIERARLLRPWSAVLARAEKDDYASGIFYPENPIRALQGKTEGLPQRFALEFFIKFKGNDRGQKAQFKVSFARLSKGRRHSAKVWATVPVNAE